jgi:hypothetical protein
MAEHIVAVFDSESAADAAAQDLEQHFHIGSAALPTDSN